MICSTKKTCYRKEYIELEYMLIYEQKLPFDSPEWQAVIEKYKRRGDVS